MEQELNHVERLPLKDQHKQTLEEARVVLPGVQALFGFQLIAVFSQPFGQELSAGEQRLHLLALCLTAISVTLCMAPTALHRLCCPDRVSDRLVAFSSVLLTAGLLPLAAALSLDAYVVAQVIVGGLPALLIAVGLALVLATFWFLLPILVRGRVNEEQSQDRKRVSLPPSLAR